MRDGHRIMDVAHLGIRTLALDANSGRFDAQPVTHLWQWDVPAEQQLTIRCADGSEVTTSAWHPFMVFATEGVQERRSDELRPGDLLLTPNRTAREAWPITAYKHVEDFLVDEDLAWLDELSELEGDEPSHEAEGASANPPTGTAPTAPETPLGGNR